MARRKKQETKYLDGNHSLFQDPRFSQYEGVPGMYLITSHCDREGRWKITNIISSGYSDPLINTVGAVVDVVFETLLGVGKEKKEDRESAQVKVDKVVGDLRLTREERSQLHYRIGGNDYMDYHEMIRIAKSMFEPINVRSSKGDKQRW